MPPGRWPENAYRIQIVPTPHRGGEQVGSGPRGDRVGGQVAHSSASSMEPCTPCRKVVTRAKVPQSKQCIRNSGPSKQRGPRTVFMLNSVHPHSEHWSVCSWVSGRGWVTCAMFNRSRSPYISLPLKVPQRYRCEKTIYRQHKGATIADQVTGRPSEKKHPHPPRWAGVRHSTPSGEEGVRERP